MARRAHHGLYMIRSISFDKTTDEKKKRTNDMILIAVVGEH